MKTWTAIVADDEIHLRKGIAALLEKHWPGLEILDTADNGNRALELIQTLKPDMAFLDIQMPGMSGMDVARTLGGRCNIIFITAHDRYAVDAFENAALDYLIKPVSERRLKLAIDRLKQRLNATVPPRPVLRKKHLEELRQALAPTAPPDYLRLIKVTMGTELMFIPVSKIFFFKSEAKYTRVQTRKTEYLIRTPVKELEGRLDPKQFWRIHRNSIINVDRIRIIKRSPHYQLRVGFEELKETLAVSRSYEHRFKQM